MGCYRVLWKEGVSQGVQVGRKGLRWILANLRVGTAVLRVESGRWVGLSREDVAQEKWKMWSTFCSDVANSDMASKRTVCAGEVYGRDCRWLSG